MTDSLALTVKAALEVEKVFSYLAGLAVVAASTAMAAHAGCASPIRESTMTSATARNDALIVFLWLPLADPSLDLRFAVILITSVCVFPRHKKTGANEGRPVWVHTDIHFGSRCNHVGSRSRLCRLNLSGKQPLSVFGKFA